MKKVADTVVDIIRGEPLTKLVRKTVEQVISSHHFQLSLSNSIERKVEKLTEIAVAQSKLINQLQEDMKALKADTQQLLANNIEEEERRL